MDQEFAAHLNRSHLHRMLGLPHCQNRNLQNLDVDLPRSLHDCCEIARLVMITKMKNSKEEISLSGILPRGWFAFWFVFFASTWSSFWLMRGVWHLRGRYRFNKLGAISVHWIVIVSLKETCQCHLGESTPIQWINGGKNTRRMCKDVGRKC